MADLIVGAVGLGLAAADDAIAVLSFIHDIVVDTKHYGDQIPAVRTRLTYETARLQSFSDYLKRRAPSGVSQFSTLHPASQSAALGLIQELEITFAAYKAYINKHGIDALRKGYSKSVEGGMEGLQLQARVGEAAEAKLMSSLGQSLRWGIFEKSRVMKLLKKLQDWNDRTMNLLLLDPVVSIGLSFKELLAEQGSSDFVMDTTESPEKLQHLDRKTRTAILESRSPDGSVFKKRVFVEIKPFELRRREKEPSRLVQQRVQRLARLLGHPQAKEAGFQTLQCINLIRMSRPENAYAFVFELPEQSFPDGAELTTLLDSIKSKTLERPTLEERFAMARSLVKTVFHLHSVDWLHKSIRSDNIILGYRQARRDYSHPLIVGFEFSRDEKDRSTTEQDGCLERNIYRHPDRQGPPENRFNALHDIYSLGVVLLEIGLWRPAVGFEADYGDMEAEERMHNLCEHAKDRLPHYLGLDYTEAVLACLNGSLLSGDVQVGMTEVQRLELNVSLFEKVLGRIALFGNGSD
ncbi:hypothetical protein NM208_g1146 [Fusarium decemcellulare]|uniref:Uncharacterized protein n=1 Tax=Fusarium decemcellulare TaxID=57161 RepID=A0ACC1SX70_9HYPO|nr:hypothetical protein NM208_g1146 [Fusarium decemcellulare]